MPARIRPQTSRTRLAALRARLAADDGLSIVEVAVTGLMTGLIALSLIGLDAAGKTAADQRRRAQAFQMAQADQERIKGLSADQIAHLNQTRTVTLDGVAFTITSTGQFLSSSANSASCSSTAAAADYAKVTSTVDWASNRRPDIVVQSTITPRAGGSLLAQTMDQNGAPLAGTRINVAGSDQSTDAVRRFGTTDSGGCTIFSALLVGDYTVAPVRTGYVDKDGDAAPTQTVTTTAGNTTTVPFTLGEAGEVTTNFKTQFGTTTLTNQVAPSMSWFNAGMATNGYMQPSSPAATINSPQNLFPFYTSTPGTYTNNYTVWAGRCTAAKPPLAANQRLVTVAPGGTGTATGTNAISMPAMYVRVTYAGVDVKPTQIELTDSCGQTWDPPIDGASTMPSATGWLDLPGQPYGTYTICADYRYTTANSGDLNYRKVTLTGRANTSFTAVNQTTVPITTTSPSGRC